MTEGPTQPHSPLHTPTLCVGYECEVLFYSVSPTPQVIPHIPVPPRILWETVHKSIWPEMTPSLETKGQVTAFAPQAEEGLPGPEREGGGGERE